MSKKKPRAKSPSPVTRWDLAFGGTNVLGPWGGWPMPWPTKLLQKTFVNMHLVQQGPFEVREEVFSGRPPDQYWGAIGTLLMSIEKEAKQLLKDEGPPCCADILADDRFFQWLTEDEFYDRFPKSDVYPHRQANAIAALRSIHVMRSLCKPEYRRGDRHLFYFLDPHGDHTYDSGEVAKLLLEMVMLILASIRGDLWENLTYQSKMREGPEHSRNDALAQEIARELKATPTARATELLARFEQLAKSGNKTIQEVTEDSEIYWRNRDGKEKTTRYHDFEKRVSRMKRRLRQKK